MHKMFLQRDHDRHFGFVDKTVKRIPKFVLWSQIFKIAKNLCNCFSCFDLFCRENFLQVDIFYQELKYQNMEQNVAFEPLSLVGEIGGFLGLLLGASVLTVCEVVDYALLACYDRLQRKKVQSQNSPKS